MQTFSLRWRHRRHAISERRLVLSGFSEWVDIAKEAIDDWYLGNKTGVGSASLAALIVIYIVARPWEMNREK